MTSFLVTELRDDSYYDSLLNVSKGLSGEYRKGVIFWGLYLNGLLFYSYVESLKGLYRLIVGLNVDGCFACDYVFNPLKTLD